MLAPCRLGYIGRTGSSRTLSMRIPQRCSHPCSDVYRAPKLGRYETMQQDTVRVKSLAAFSDGCYAAILAAPPFVLAVLVGLLDVWHPADVVFSALYVAPIVLTLRANSSRQTYLLFLATTVATVAVAAFSPAASPTAALANRILALVAEVLAAVVVMQQLDLRARDRDRLRRHQREAVQAQATATRAEAGLCSLQDVLRSLPDAVFTLDGKGHILESNAAAARMLGDIVHGYAGRPWADLVRALGGDEPADRQQMTELLPADWPARGPATASGELTVRRGADKDPLFCIVTAAKLLAYGLVTGGVVLCRDVTVLRERENQKDEFVAMATHELKTPLSTLRGYAQILEANAERMQAADVAASAEKIVRQVDRLGRLMNDLLDVSRIHTGRMGLRFSEVRIMGLARDALEHQPAMHPDRSLVLEDRGGADRLLADGPRLEQVLTNLLDNAVKYSPDGGHVVLTIEGTVRDIGRA